MSDSFEEIALHQSIIRKQWLPLDVAVQEVLAFEQHFGTPHFLLACHAALPSLLTPELLHSIRLNFLDQQPPRPPWIAEMDFLLSSLCRPIDQDWFEVEPMVREALLYTLQERYGRQRLQDVSAFLQQYLHKTHQRKHNASIAQLHEWIAQAYLQPDKVVQDLAHLLSESVDLQSDEYQTLPKKLQVARTMELLAEPLGRTLLQEEYQGLLHSARVLAYSLYGNRQALSATPSLPGLSSNQRSVLFPPAVQQWLNTLAPPATVLETVPVANAEVMEEVPEAQENWLDQQLRLAGWVVQEKDDIDVRATPGIAIRDFSGNTSALPTGYANYLLVIDSETVGVIKLVGHDQEHFPISLTIPLLPMFVRSPLPFLYEVDGHEIVFTNHLEPEARSRPVFHFHQPQTFAAWLQQAPVGRPNELNDLLRSRLRRMPPISPDGWRSQFQLQVITEIEKSLLAYRPRTLIQLPDGGGKTITLISIAYRLLTFASAKPILYLVQEGLDRVTYRKFDQFSVPGSGKKFTELFKVQSSLNNLFESEALIYIATIKEFFEYFLILQIVANTDANLQQISPDLQSASYDAANKMLDPFQYNPLIPIEFFDAILIDNCESDTYRKWLPLFSYFDAFIIGATSDADPQTLSFFNKNLVYSYQQQPGLVNTITDSMVDVLWKYRSAARDLGVSTGSYLEQLTYLLFLKIAHERVKSSYQETTYLLEGYDWLSLLNSRGSDLDRHYRHILAALGNAGGLVGTIFKNATNKIPDPEVLHQLIDSINETYWSGFSPAALGRIYDTLLQKNAADRKSSAGQHFTPRPLIQAIVNVMRPQPEQTICDPACGTGGFLVDACRYMLNPLQHSLSPQEVAHVNNQSITGYELVDDVARLAAMNLFMHGIQPEDGSSPIIVQDSLFAPSKRLFDMVLCHLPFGRKSRVFQPNRRLDFVVETNSNPLNFIQHIKVLLKSNGRAAVIVPDSVLSEPGAGQKIREDLLKTCDLHTLLRLPTGIFYAQTIKASVLFFDRLPASDKPQTPELWIYDFRTNQNFTLRTPLRREDLEDFVRCYNSYDRHQRTETERFRRFSYDQLITRNNLNLDIFGIAAPSKDTIHHRFTDWLTAREYLAEKPLTPEQITWLERIRDRIATTNLKFEEEDFNSTPFTFDGALTAARFLFGKDLPGILQELNELLLREA